MGLLAVGTAVAVMIIDLLSGYCEGRTYLILQLLMYGIQAIPGCAGPGHLVVLRPSTTNAMIAIAVVIIPGNSRIVRAVLAAKQNRYVEAAQAIGCRHPRIILTHILPNVTAPILVIASIWLATRS